MTEQGGDTPLIPQPSHGSILQRAAALARTMAFENTNDPMGETQEFNPLETAPGLEQVTQQLMDEYEMPESIWMILDSEEIYLAGRALELLPTEQLAALQKALETENLEPEKLEPDSLDEDEK